MAFPVRFRLFLGIDDKGGMKPVWLNSVALDHFTESGAITSDGTLTPHQIAQVLRIAQRMRDHAIEDGYCGDAFDEWKAEEAPPPAPPRPQREMLLATMREMANAVWNSSEADTAAIGMFMRTVCDVFEGEG